MKKIKKSGFTLYEIIIVLVIVAVLASLGLPNFIKAKEHALGREARQHLKIILESEKAFRMQKGAYYPNGSTIADLNAINSNLSLTLVNTSWDYSISADQNRFDAVAARAGSGGYLDCQYEISYDFTSRNNTEEPVGSPACP